MVPSDDTDDLRPGFDRWLARELPGHRVLSVDRPETGLSARTLFLEVGADGGPAGRLTRSLVARLPPAGEGLFPAYDLAAQGRLQSALADAGIPAVEPWTVEEDPSYVGAPFLLMARVPGRTVRNDRRYLTRGWLAEGTPEEQGRLHASFLDTLAAVHRLDPVDDAGVFAAARRPTPTGTAPGGPTLARELAWWADYLAWAGEGSAPAVFDEALTWCRDHLPPTEPPASVLWGDAHLGNAVYADDWTVAAVVDFELASVGPAELDLGWFLVLHAMTAERCGGEPPGFPDRAATVDAYRDRLGRDLADLAWYETFAALRSAAVTVRMAHLLARQGIPDGWLATANPTVSLLERLVRS